MPVVNVKGVGIVRFPDTMSQDEIIAVLKKQHPITAPGATAAPKAPAPVPQDDTSFFPPLDQYGRRMAKFALSPIKPLAQLGHALASKIDITERPSISQDFTPPESNGDKVKLALSVLASPLLSVARAAQEAPSAIAAISREPGAGLRGLLAGLTEGATQLSPVDAALMKGGFAGGGEAFRNVFSDIARGDVIPTLRKPGPVAAPAPPPPGPPRTSTGTGSVAHVSSSDLGELAREVADKIRSQPPTGTAFPAPANTARTGTAAATRSMSPEEIAAKIVQEVKKPGGPKSVSSVSTPPGNETISPEWTSWKSLVDRRAATLSSQRPGMTIGQITADAMEFAGAEPEKYVRAGADAGVAPPSTPTAGVPPSEPQPATLQPGSPNSGGRVTPKVAATGTESVLGPGRKQATAARRKAADAGIDAQAKAVQDAADKAAKEAQLAAEKRKRALDQGEPEPKGETPVPGTIRSEAYAKGATPAEAAASRIAEQAAMTDISTSLPKLPKAGSRAAKAMAAEARSSAAAPAAAEVPKPKLVKAAAKAAKKEQARPLSERSAEVAAKIDPAVAAPIEPVAPPPEAGAEARASILTQAGRGHLRLVPGLMEQARQAIPTAQEALAGAQEPPITPAGQQLVDTLNAFQAGGVPEGIERNRSVTGMRVPSGTTPKVPVEAQGAVKIVNPPHEMSRPPVIDRMQRLVAASRKQIEGGLKPEAETPSTRGASLDEIRAGMAGKPVPAAERAPSKMQKAIQALQEKQAAQRALDEARAKAEAAQIPQGVEPDQYVTMQAVEEHARELASQGIHDPRFIGEMRRWYGSREAARRIGVPLEVVQEAGVGRQKPMEAVMHELDARYDYLIRDPRGFMNTEAVAAMLGAAAGGTLGASAGGDNVEEKVAYGLSGLILGGYAGLSGARGLASLVDNAKGIGAKTKAAQEAAYALDSANLLAGPAAMKASFGSIGGVAAGLVEQMEMGNKAGVRAALRYMKREGPADWWRTLTGPGENLRPSSAYTGEIAKRAGLLNKFSDKVLQVVLRPFVAADKVGTEALRRMGYSKAEGERLMLMGEPTTWQGQSAVRILSSNMAWRLLAKFPRVRIGGFERALEYTPGLNKFVDTRPQASPHERFIPQEKLSPAQLRARAKFGAAAIGTGALYGYYKDPGVAESSIFSAMAGPAAVPFGAGVAAGKAIGHGNPGILQAIEAVSSSLPQINEQDILQLPNRVIPLRPLRRGLVNLGLIKE